MHWQKAQDTLLRKLFDYTRLGLITDMDGVISPIVPVPSDAAPTERNKQLLTALHEELALVAVVSGRSAADVHERVGLAELIYVGNHGLERWQDGSVKAAPEIAPYRSNLEAAIEAMQPYLAAGMWVEDKGATLSIHYRNAANPAQAAKQFQPHIEQIAADTTLKVFQGRMIFELRPPIDMNKGTAFHALVTEHALDAAIYIGDDTTDVDAMKVARHLREQGTCYALAVGVESDDAPAAVIAESDLLTSGVSDVESFFAWLLKAASASST